LHLKKPYFRYGTTYVLPGVPVDDVSITHTAERYENVAADGTTVSYYVGPRDFVEKEWRWIDSTSKGYMETWWNAVRDGTHFWLVYDDSIRLMDNSWDFDNSYTIGTDSDGVAITETEYITDDTDLVFTPEAVDGFWRTVRRFREVV
jgi:hypothetical protein